jgi:hypothetical protein
MSSGALGSLDHPARWESLVGCVFSRCRQNGFTIAKSTIDIQILSAHY